jgi:hypothetical protein
MIHSKETVCDRCGSDSPSITIGWPVCLNDVFHQEIRHTGRWWYKGRHRARFLGQKK